MTKWLIYLPELTLFLSAGLLLNPDIRWEQVVSLLLVYLLFAGVRLIQYFELKSKDLDDQRLDKIESEIKMLIQADSFRNLK